jgi:hypothetical protein
MTTEKTTASPARWHKVSYEEYLLARTNGYPVRVGLRGLREALATDEEVASVFPYDREG